MKTVLFCLAMTIVYYSSNSNKVQHQVSTTSQADSSHRIIFETEIKPIFISHCMPCHFTGGKMYDRLPFDKQDTIIAHQSGILKRIKNEKETALIKEFVSQQKNK